MKVIQFKTPDGLYYIPLKDIAENRAEYYMHNDGFSKFSTPWQDEIDYVMEDGYEGIDWLMGNSNFEDWEDTAVKVNDHKGLISNDDFWCCSDDFEIVTIEV